MPNPCPGCNKFAALEMAEPETDIEIDEETGDVTGTVRVVLQSSCCSEEMKDNEFNVQVEGSSIDGLTAHIEGHKSEEDDEDGEPEAYSLEVTGDAVADDYFQSTDRYGQPIKNPRYQKHFYGYSLDFTVTCSCGEEFEGSTVDHEQASAFNELV